jgi:cell division protein FtsL
MEAATARTAPARRRPAAPARRAPGRRPRRRSAPAVRAMRPAVAAGAALLPQAAVRSVGAVRDLSDSGLIVRLTRGRGWIAVLCVLLVGIVALNVLSLSLNAGSGRLSLQIDELKTEVSALRAEIDERLSASRVEAEAARLGLAVPDPAAITYLSASHGDAERLSRLLATDSFLTAPSQPSSYPTGGSTYTPPAAAPQTATVAPTATTPAPTGTTPSSDSTTTTTGSSSGSSGSSPSSGASTGGVGL